MIEELVQYISPELLIAIPVLYLIGLAIKKTSKIADKFIPLILGLTGIFICLLYEFMMLGISFEAGFAAIIQGVLVAAVAVYGNQFIKQTFKIEA